MDDIWCGTVVDGMLQRQSETLGSTTGTGERLLAGERYADLQLDPSLLSQLQFRGEGRLRTPVASAAGGTDVGTDDRLILRQER